MPLIANNIIINGQDFSLAPNNQIVDVNGEIDIGGEKYDPVVNNNPAVVSSTRGNPSNEDHHILIVDGKEKMVSKHSSYLLDMLTIDKQ
jgi:hypothetical protein